MSTPRVIIAALLVLPCGCSKEDPDRLARLGRKLAAHATAAVPSAGVRDRLARLSSGVGAAGVESAVLQRLTSDKELQGCEWDISQPEPGVVRLAGRVERPGQRVRAEELARLTVGVREVSSGEWRAASGE